MREQTLRTDSNQTYPAKYENTFAGDDIFGLYLHDIKRHAIPDREETLRLVEIIQVAKTAREELETSEGLSVDQREILSEAVKNGVDARNNMLLGNTGLTFNLVRKREGFTRNMDRLDLLQEANIAILKAAETYNPDKSAFSTHASLRIRAELADAIAEQDRAIRIPNYHVMKIQQRDSIKREYENTNLVLTDDKLAEEMHVELEYLDELRDMEWGSHSLNFQMSGKDGHTTETGEMISDLMAPSVEDIVLGDDSGSDYLSERMREAVVTSRLSETQQKVLWLRYAEGQRIDDITEQLGISRGSVSKIAAQAIEVFRKELEAMGGVEHFKQKVEAVSK